MKLRELSADERAAQSWHEGQAATDPKHSEWFSSCWCCCPGCDPDCEPPDGPNPFYAGAMWQLKRFWAAPIHRAYGRRRRRRRR